MQQSHDGPLCARIGHYVAGITIGYCPHYQSLTLVIRAGDETDDTSWRMERIDFGPFDSVDDVQRYAAAELARLLRADRAAWGARREGPESQGSPTTEG